MNVRNVEDLIAVIDEGKRPKYVFFWGGKVRRDGSIREECLSQWYPGGFEVDGEVYSTAEHWMMAEKARLFDDEEKRQEILAASNPKEAKALGRQVRGFRESVWLEHRFEIVTRGNVHKFSQDPDLRRYLIATNQRVLVEASPWDRIWGIGMRSSDHRCHNPRNWDGLNLLGFALMEARERILSAHEG